MPVSALLSAGVLYAFLLVLARIAGALVLIPLPGMQQGTETPRIAAALAITLLLFPSWPRLSGLPDSVAALVLSILCEAVFGACIGIAVACFSEMLIMSAQIVSQHAGFGYASMIDPMTAADSAVLLVVARLIGGLLFLSFGLDREVLRVLAESLRVQPPGTFHPSPQLAETLWRYASEIFSVGVRLALPSIALLGLIDLSLALLGRINSRLQLTHLSFPIKMLAAIVLIAFLSGMYARVLSPQAGMMMRITRMAAGLQHGG